MRKSICNVVVDGTDLSSRWSPLLIDLTVKLDDEGSMDEATFTLDDTDAQIGLPRKRATVLIEQGWSDTGIVQVFNGFVDEVRWHISRGAGRVMTVRCKSGDMGGDLKQEQSDSMDNTTLGEAARKWGSAAGLDMSIDGALGAIKKTYIDIQDSFLSWMERHSYENGATFKVVGTRGVLVPRNGNASASGATLEPITAEVGVNVISIDASPILSRPEYGQFGTRHYDPVEAVWKLATSGSGAVAHRHHYKAPNEDDAQRQSEANGMEVARERAGAESVVIDGEPMAQPKAACTVSGARPGVDGIYTISSVTHTLSRGSGFLTTLALKDPSGDVGVDDRTEPEGDQNETPVTTPNPIQGGGIGGLPPNDGPAQPGGVGSA